MNTQKPVKKIYGIKVERHPDTDPDTSYLGNYSDTRTSEYSIDRAHKLDCYANTGAVEPEKDAEIARMSDKLNEFPQGQTERLSRRNYGPSPDEEPCGCIGDEWHRREYRYFNPSSNYVDKSGKLLPENTPEEVRKYVREDYERMERLNNGDWHYLGIKAVAEVGVSLDGGKTFKIDKLTSGGLWGIESDSDDSYIRSTAKDELNELKDILSAYGFGRSAVAKAIKEAKFEDV